jgi:hypothetical protein
MNYRNNIKHLSVLLLLLAGACKKEGTLEKATGVVQLSMSLVSVNSEAAFQVMVNEELVSDTLSVNKRGSAMIRARETGNHVQVRDHASDQVVLDTVLAANDRQLAINLLQLVEGEPPMLLPQTNTDLPEGARRLSFFATDTLLPPAFGIQIYAVYSNLMTGEYLKADTIATFPKIERGVLSEIKIIQVPVDAGDIGVGFYFQPLDAQTGLPLSNQLRPFDPAAFRGNVFGLSDGPTGTEKNYINGIRIIKAAGKLIFLSSRLMSY